jgi:hypothetical protein
MDLDFTDFLADKAQVKAMVEAKGRYDWRDFVQKLPHNKQANYAFLNRGDLRFENKARELGLGDMTYSNGAAYGDLDGDGDLELVVNNVNQPAGIYKNTSSENGRNFVSVKLEGPSGNLAGVGAKVQVMHGEAVQLQEQYPSRGFLSTVSQQLVFGLGDYAGGVDIQATWPDGLVTTLLQVATNQATVVRHAEAASQKLAKPTTGKALFADVTGTILNTPAVHEEPFFNDFDHEALLLRKLSDPGPEVVKGDPNGDGLEDFLLLGSFGYPDKLYQQKADGTFALQTNNSFDGTASYESSAGAFYDADGDGDDDLMIGSGGNEYARGFNAYTIRFYENIDGQLILNNVLSPPNTGAEVSVIAPCDIDFDGDMDVFIGGRAIPGNYGLPPQSFLFIRDKGTYINRTPEDIGTAGMVTDAVWSDLNTDGRPDLIMVGDWMPVTVAFMLHDAEISATFQIPNSSGMWNSVEAADFDQDGKEDLVLMNWGQNSKFKASAEKPLKMHVNDFDDNGKTEFIVEWFPPADETLYPFASKREMHGQMPHLRKKTLKYSDFAAATYESLFTEEERAKALTLSCEELRSSIIWNKGDGQVRIEPLPWQAQLTTQFTSAIEDVNGDGKLDLWLGGNIFGLTPQVGRSDAGRGTLLLNAGDRNWTFVDNAEVGISVKGQVRDAQFINLADGAKGLLVGINNEPMKIYRLNEQPTK